VRFGAGGPGDDGGASFEARYARTSG
jgi:hypothetical protein